MSEELEVLKTVTQRLEGAGIGYMVTGSMALNYYAVPRMTRDIDLVAELSPGDAERVVELFRDDFYLDREAIRRAIEEQESFNIIETTRVVKVDFVVRKDVEYRRVEFARRSALSDVDATGTGRREPPRRAVETSGTRGIASGPCPSS